MKEAMDHDEAMAIFNTSVDASEDEREQSYEDRRFAYVPGAQWEGDLADVYENKPKFEVNKTRMALMRLKSEARNNPITVDFKSREGDEYDELADVCDGLFRADVIDSMAEIAFENAFDEASCGGYGAWRLRNDYEDEEDERDERQRIFIEPIYDADKSVFWDSGALRQDKRDATDCFVITPMTRTAYEEKYDDIVSEWPDPIEDNDYDWVEDNLVRIAEHYHVEQTNINIQVWEDVNGKKEYHDETEFKDDEALESRLLALGNKLVSTKKVKRNKIRKYIRSGNDILEDVGYIAGNRIPIVPQYGDRVVINSIERASGIIRVVKDTVRLANMQRSKLAEISAMSPISKPIVTPQQVAGWESLWANDSIENNPVLYLNPIEDEEGRLVPSGPIGYTKAPEIPQAMAALLSITEQDLIDLLGSPQAGEQMSQNIAEGTVQLIQNRIDMQSYSVMHNRAQAMKVCGEIWLGMARDLYVEEGRKMRSVDRSGETSSVELGQPLMDDESGQVKRVADLSEAKFDIFASVGASSDSKRNSTIQSLTRMLQATADPESQRIISNLLLMNTEGEGLSDTHVYFRNKLVRDGVIEPTKEEQKAMEEEQANRPEDPNAKFLEASSNEANANAKNKDADSVNKLATAEKTAAQTQEILAGIDADKLKLVIEMLDKVAGSEAEIAPVAGTEVQVTTQP